MTFYLPAIRPSLVCLLAVASLLIAPYANSATTWQTINSNIQFLKQAHKLRFYDSNQVLMEGEKCALLFDASGNFAADEQLAKDLKKRLKTPLCYLVASHYHDDHLLGMAVIQHFYPNAKLIVHQYVDTNFNEFQKAYNDKLDNYEKSIELSYQRLAKVTEEEQAQWRKKLELAKNRLFRWQTYQLKSPSIVIKKIKKIDLGGIDVSIIPQQAHTRGDLVMKTNNGTILIGGDIVDWLPYPGHGELNHWQTALTQYINDKHISLIIPGHGDILTQEQLRQPLLFLKTITEHIQKNKNQTLEQLISSFPSEILKPYQVDKLDKKSSQLFLEAGLRRLKNEE